jgi:hypothetical protein
VSVRPMTLARLTSFCQEPSVGSVHHGDLQCPPDRTVDVHLHQHPHLLCHHSIDERLDQLSADVPHRWLLWSRLLHSLDEVSLIMSRTAFSTLWSSFSKYDLATSWVPYAFFALSCAEIIQIPLGIAAGRLKSRYMLAASVASLCNHLT